MLVGCGSLPKLEKLCIVGDANGDEGLVPLADGLRRGGLPALQNLLLLTGFGPQGATTLCAAFTKRALPSLLVLALDMNPLGVAGLRNLLPGLRQLPNLLKLSLTQTNIGDEGVASLVTQPAEGAFKTLQYLHLRCNEITDAGYDALASALRVGALPAIYDLDLEGNPGERSQEAVDAVLATRFPEESDEESGAHSAEESDEESDADSAEGEA